VYRSVRDRTVVSPKVFPPVSGFLDVTDYASPIMTYFLGACACPRKGVTPFFTVYPKDARCARTFVRPKESGTHSDEKAVKPFFVCRPSPGLHSGRSSVIHRPTLEPCFITGACPPSSSSPLNPSHPSLKRKKTMTRAAIGSAHQMPAT
jgi:hypothetical protein